MSKLCVAGSKVVDICETGDKLIEEELSKVYRGKKINKGACVHACVCVCAVPGGSVSGSWVPGFPLGIPR